MLPAMPDEPTPTPKKFTFKPKEFERVNEVRPNTREEETTPVPLANDVYAIRRELREREAAAGFDELTPPDRPRSNRRRNDYWLVMAMVNGVFLPLALWALSTKNAVLFIYSLSAAVFLSAAITWVMWVLMDRY